MIIAGATQRRTVKAQRSPDLGDQRGGVDDQAALEERWRKTRTAGRREAKGKGCMIHQSRNVLVGRGRIT